MRKYKVGGIFTSKLRFLFLINLVYSPSLFKSMATAFGLPYLMAAGLKLIHDILQFVGPIMLQRIITFLELEEMDAVGTLIPFYL